MMMMMMMMTRGGVGERGEGREAGPPNHHDDEVDSDQ